MLVYVNRENNRYFQVSPIPENLNEWVLAEFPGTLEELGGYYYHFEEEIFIPVVYGESLNVNRRRIPVLSFRRRFTMEEKVAIYTAAKTNPVIQIMLDEIELVQTGVLLDDPDVVQGVYYLAQLGIISQEKLLQILRDGEDSEY